MFIWFIIFYLMADVMARGHGGDGAEDPPPPYGRGRGQHHMDVVPPQRRRGKAKNLKLTPTWVANGKKPLSLVWDSVTGTTVGDIHDLFIREISLIIQRDIPLDRRSWKNVDSAEKNALFEQLRPYFDIDSVMEDPGQVKFVQGLETMIANSYKSRKSHAKAHFLQEGGYEDVERARERGPDNMDPENWKKVVTFFTGDDHLKVSARNKANRAKQEKKNRGGTASYSQAAFKQGKSRVQVYYDAHTNKDGVFEDPRDEETYNALVREVVEETQHLGSSSNLTPFDEAAIFEKVLGVRRGRIRGIGPKPSGTPTPPSSQNVDRHPRASQETQMVNSILRDPSLRSTITNLFRSYSSQGEPDQEQNEERNDEGDDSEE